jgi:hypothetical protein
MLYTLLGIGLLIAFVVSANVWNVVQGFGWPALLGAVIGGALAWPQHCTPVGYFSLNVSTRTTVCTSQHFRLCTCEARLSSARYTYRLGKWCWKVRSSWPSSPRSSRSSAWR